MSQSLAKILLHLVFSTKNRVNMISPEVFKELYAYLAGICRKYDSEVFNIGGTENHVHIGCTLSRTVTVCKLLEEVKKSSSIWIKHRDPYQCHFSWQAGYGVFSLGQSQLETLIRYIDEQTNHHKKITYQEELIGLLNKYQVEYDEKYIWK